MFQFTESACNIIALKARQIEQLYIENKNYQPSCLSFLLHFPQGKERKSRELVFIPKSSQEPSLFLIFFSLVLQGEDLTNLFYRRLILLHPKFVTLVPQFYTHNI